MNKYYNANSLVFHQGEFRSPATIGADMYSQTLHYGNGVFEGIRAYRTASGTSIYKAKEHYERLRNGAGNMGLPLDHSIEELIAFSYQLLEKNGLQDAYIRPLLVAGPNMGLTRAETSVLTIQCWEWPKYMGDQLLRVMTSSFQRPNPKSCFIGSKVTGHYTNSILSTSEAKEKGFDESLLLDMNGNVAECSGANIFMEKDGRLVTPARGHIMAGITRAAIMDIARDHGMEVEERFFTLDELKQADSAFFTGTAAEVTGLASLDAYVFPLEWERSLGHKLMELYMLDVRNALKPVVA